MRNNKNTASQTVQTKLTIPLVKNEIDEFLANFMHTQVMLAKKQSGEYTKLWQTIEAVVMSGGKRIRPYLLLCGHGLYSSQPHTPLLPVAASHELLHISMLVHDDIIDRDYERHGKLNVAGSYRQIYAGAVATKEVDHYATSAALVAGDLLLSSAYSLVNTSALEPEQKIIAHGYLHDSIFNVVGGELSDVESAFMPVYNIDPVHIAIYKTAVYSFVNPLLCGAELAGASESDTKILRDFAINCGIAFQLTDDLLGVFGDESKTGKSTMSDLQEGKGTYLVQQTLERASDSDRATFTKFFGKQDLSDTNAATLRSIIESSGAKQATIEAIEMYAEKAKSALDSLQASQEYVHILQALLHKMTHREA